MANYRTPVSLKIMEKSVISGHHELWVGIISRFKRSAVGNIRRIPRCKSWNRAKRNHTETSYVKDVIEQAFNVCLDLIRDRKSLGTEGATLRCTEMDHDSVRLNMCVQTLLQ